MPIAGESPQVLFVKFQYQSAPSHCAWVCGVSLHVLLVKFQNNLSSQPSSSLESQHSAPVSVVPGGHVLSGSGTEQLEGMSSGGGLLSLTQAHRLLLKLKPDGQLRWLH